MKKVYIHLLILIVACGGSSEETVVQDTTTTTIPPAPTVDFNIVEIYNKNIGSESELCSDAEEIEFIQQGMNEQTPLNECIERLQHILGDSMEKKDIEDVST